MKIQIDATLVEELLVLLPEVQDRIPLDLPGDMRRADRLQRVVDNLREVTNLQQS